MYRNQNITAVLAAYNFNSGVGRYLVINICMMCVIFQLTGFSFHLKYDTV